MRATSLFFYIIFVVTNNWCLEINYKDNRFIKFGRVGFVKGKETGSTKGTLPLSLTSSLKIYSRSAHNQRRGLDNIMQGASVYKVPCVGATSSFPHKYHQHEDRKWLLRHFLLSVLFFPTGFSIALNFKHWISVTHTVVVLKWWNIF